MLFRHWQQRFSYLLTLSVFVFALAWGEHQLEQLDPHHSEHHCSLCFHLGKLATAICSAGPFIALAVGSIGYLPVSYRYSRQHTLAALARAPPYPWH